jgi:hypothetical protein
VPHGLTRQEDMNGDITPVADGSSILLSNSPVLLMDDPPLAPPTDLSSTVD